ncbi:hypothetical protein DL93DRAFT_2050887 [Clavulina sp. PMI_390]|nr:hypothetical protein DL93DRAFT_2050887 [Clavulina sp. PMI_390]
MLSCPLVQWPNVLFFCGMHAVAVMGVYLRPVWVVPRSTLVLCFVSWQLAVFGITIGYHRLYSHRSFTARRPLRLVLALMGCLGFQGSIKWWCARHRLHHRYTDDPVHDPYCATKGLYYSHMGWIFRKPTYPRMHLIDRSDLDNDPVVRFQHKHYIPLTLGLGLILPIIIAASWGDAFGGFIWGGVVARLLIWHCTFIVNSFAHWDGLQPYSDEMSARGNLLFAILTGGEGNHNFHHTFPHDYRASPHLIDWDPSKWIIETLYRFTSQITSLRTTSDLDIKQAQQEVSQGQSIKETATIENEVASSFEVWNQAQIEKYVEGGHTGGTPRRVVVINECVVDVTDYIHQHPGGFIVLRPYLIGEKVGRGVEWKDASWAFGGGMNKHSSIARQRMRDMKIARISPEIKNVLKLDDVVD